MKYERKEDIDYRFSWRNRSIQVIAERSYGTVFDGHERGPAMATPRALNAGFSGLNPSGKIISPSNPLPKLNSNKWICSFLYMVQLIAHQVIRSWFDVEKIQVIDDIQLDFRKMMQLQFHCWPKHSSFHFDQPHFYQLVHSNSVR